VLSFANYENLARADAYFLPWAVRSAWRRSSTVQPLQWKVSELCLEDLEALEWDERENKVADSRSPYEIAETDWPAWFRGLRGQRRDEVIAELDAWLREEPDWGWEDDYLPDRATGQGAAFKYFEDTDCAVLKALKIRLIDGDRPGSNYIGAHLEIPFTEANGIAAKNGWTIRFVREGVA
jgi:hypothetical protein